MSKGLGKAERWVLACLTLDPAGWFAVRDIALARPDPVASVEQTTRRAVRRLERAGMAAARLAPTESGEIAVHRLALRSRRLQLTARLLHAGRQWSEERVLQYRLQKPREHVREVLDELIAAGIQLRDSAARSLQRPTAGYLSQAEREGYVVWHQAAMSELQSAFADIDVMYSYARPLGAERGRRWAPPVDLEGLHNELTGRVQRLTDLRKTGWVMAKSVR